MRSLPLPLFGRSSSGPSKKSLKKLASKRRWSDLLEALETPRGARQASECDFQGHVLLHHVIAHDPPLNAVERVIEAYPAALAAGGMSKCLPLHCAIMYGSRADVVKVLVEARSEATAERDAEGRTALYLAVCKACDALDDIGGEDETADFEEERDRAMAVVELMCRHSPKDAAELPALDGTSALDVAISRERGEDCPVVALLREGMRKTDGDPRGKRPSLAESVESDAEGSDGKEWGEARLRELMNRHRSRRARNPSVLDAERNEPGSRAA